MKMRRILALAAVLALLPACMLDGGSSTELGTQSTTSGAGTTGGGGTTTNNNGNCGPFTGQCVGGTTGSGSATLVTYLGFDEEAGTISGYAYEQGDTSVVVTVELYINGPAGGGGTLLTSMAANQTSATGSGSYYFSYLPPSTYIDSKPRKLYAYTAVPGQATTTLMNGLPVDYFAGPDANGQAYFNANLQSVLSTQCASCHQTEWGNYYTVRSLLASPNSPISGGTATNNTFYMTVSNAVPHAGGDQCSGNSICQDLVTWYGMDFGN